MCDTYIYSNDQFHVHDPPEVLMELQERLQQDLKYAMRHGQTVRRNVIRFIRSSIHNKEIERQETLTDDGIIEVLEQQIKQRLDSIDAFKKGAGFESLDGVAYRGPEGIIIQEKRNVINDLDILPFPARHLLPMEKYIDEQEAHGAVNDRWTTILSSRGCPYGCTFCDSRRTKFISRSAKDVVDEIEHCYTKYGIVEFHFEDDNMTLQRDRIIEICEEIIKREIDIKWQTPNGIRASVTDEIMLLKMKKSGCTHITLAPESGSERVMQEIVQKGKDFSHDQLLDIGRIACNIGMKSAAYFILGLPGETIDDIKQTIAYANKLARAGVDEVAFGLFIPLPGTPLWDHVVDNYGQPDFLDLLVIGDMNKAVSWADDITSEELNYFRRRAYLEFQLNRMIFHPIKFWRTIFNVFRGFAETKTENKIRTFIKRQSNKTNKYTPYDTNRTISVLLKNNPVYAYTESTYKSIRTVFKNVWGFKPINK